MAITSTYGLTNATLPFALEIARSGFSKGLKSHPALLKGVNIARGKITYAATAKDLGLPYTSLSRLF